MVFLFLNDIRSNAVLVLAQLQMRSSLVISHFRVCIKHTTLRLPQSLILTPSVVLCLL